MAKYIDVEPLDVMDLSNKSDEFCEGVRFALEEIDKLPTADVVEVVRCKDCKHRDEMCMCCHPRHEGILPLTYPLDFCSYGERK